MPRRKRTPEEIARKAKVRELMQELDINDMTDINALFKNLSEIFWKTVWKPNWMTNSATASTIIATKTPTTAAMGTAQKR